MLACSPKSQFQVYTSGGTVYETILASAPEGTAAAEVYKNNLVVLEVGSHNVMNDKMLEVMAEATFTVQQYMCWTICCGQSPLIYYYSYTGF